MSGARPPAPERQATATVFVVLWCSHLAGAMPDASSPDAESRWRAAGLTPRERDVAALVALGLTNRELAERLVITEKTAKNHVQRILEKLEVHSRHHLIAQALAHTPLADCQA